MVRLFMEYLAYLVPFTGILILLGVVVAACVAHLLRRRKKG